MLICPKCSKTFSDDSKICRDCGAILEPLAESQSEPTRDELMEPALNSDEAEPDVAWNPTPWQCPNCKESIEANFDACWNCGTNRYGVTNPAFISERMEPERPVPPQRKMPKRNPCPRCGSTRIIPNAYIGEPGSSYMDGKVVVCVEGNPEAWIFKDVERSKLKAEICGDCGHVELKVTNPVVLYEHYRRSLEDT